DYLTRVRGSGAWLDQISGRLRDGARTGRLPVGPLAEQALGWAEAILAAPESSPVLSPKPPQDWARTTAWEAERRAAVADVVQPALARWADTVRELLPQARAAEHAGLKWLPDGDADYTRAIQVYTTLPLSVEELHKTGLDY